MAVNWEKWTAISTLALAVATVGLGVVAARANRFARRGVEIAAAELQAASIPLLEPDPRRDDTATESVDFAGVGVDEVVEGLYVGRIVVEPAPARALVSVPLRNVGPGMAKVDRVFAWSTPDKLTTEGAATRALVPSGETVRLNFSMSGVRYELFAEATYTDLAGQQARTIRVLATRVIAELTGETLYVVRGFVVIDAVGDYSLAGDRHVVEEPRPSDSSYRPASRTSVT